jgi:hypothetical protein
MFLKDPVVLQAAETAHTPSAAGSDKKSQDPT